MGDERNEGLSQTAARAWGAFKSRTVLREFWNVSARVLGEPVVQTDLTRVSDVGQLEVVQL